MLMMSTPNEKLAASLEVLQQLQKEGRRVFKSDEMPRYHRDRLRNQGFLRQVMKGWWMSWSPDALPGDTTPWNASFWEFCARYCDERFGDEWHLSPEQSLLLHAEATSIPDQVVVYTPHGTNNTIDLLFGTSIYDLKSAPMPPAEEVIERKGIRLFALPTALIKVPESFFHRSSIEAQIALASIDDPSDLLERLLTGGHSVVARRLTGAFRRVDRPDVADEILATMTAAGHQMREVDPFEPDQTLANIQPRTLPIVGRMEALWEKMRGTVAGIMPDPPGLPLEPEAYLRFVDDIYRSDAYHSLSIEGYHVTAELIERVRSGEWDPENQEDDRHSMDALAARGYWQAFQAAKEGVREVLGGENPGTLARRAHREWYRELFQPFVVAGILPPQALAGYRKEAVYLRGSRHVPPRWEAVRDAMPALFDLLEHEPEASVRAVLGHWMVGYIHPYRDGNGRVARFLMNVMLASGGYPWTVIRVEDRDQYMAALESASIDTNIVPFTEFIAERVESAMEAAEEET